MSVGEALVHGLLGGTVGATEHYYTDWKDRVTRARNQAEKEDDRAHDAKVRQEEYAQRDKEAKTEREFRTEERLGAERFQAGQNEAEVDRQARLHDTKQQIDEKYHKKTVQFGWDENAKQLVPITTDNQQSLSMKPVAERDKDGNFKWYGNASGKGLLSRSGSGSGKGADPFTNVKLPTGNPLSPTEDRTIYTDPETSKQYQIIPDGQGNMVRIPFNAMEEIPVSISPEQQLAANQFADKTVDQLAGWFTTDATDFSDWGGSREAAKEYFRQNYLQGSHLDNQGRLRLPGSGQPTQTPKQEPTVIQSNDRTEAFTTMYGQLNADQQNTLKQAMKAIQIDKRDPALVQQRLLEYGFTPEQLSLIF